MTDEVMWDHYTEAQAVDRGMQKEEEARRQWRKMEADNLESGMCYDCECNPCRCDYHAFIDYYEAYSDADMGL